MSRLSATSQDNELILSPKETEERHKRALVLQNIDKQIDNILMINRQQNNDYSQFVDKISSIQSFYIKENRQLKETIQAMTIKYQHVEGLLQATKQQLQKTISEVEVLIVTNNNYAKETAKLKAMVKNQENLIDQYKRNMEEQLQLEKELIKSTYNEEKIKIEKDFNHVLTQIEKQYEQKLKKFTNQLKVKEYKDQFGELKKYLLNNKENFQKVLKKSASNVKKPTISQYSTNDQQARHNQAVFIP